MFFAPPGSSATPPPGGQPTDIGTVKKLLNDLSTEMSKFSITNFTNTAVEEIFKLQKSVDTLNASLLGTRTRLVEMGRAVADAAPAIVAMGGKLEDTQATIADIAAGTRRNVIASTKDVEQLFAVGALTGKKVNEIVDSFAKAGMNYRQIGNNVRDSINLANSLGVNAKAVMGAVVENTDKLQRFNFEGGVQGLAKMAAQASMLRFDMAETFKLAEDVMDPERAVEIASAFQRLGVSAGNLVDPFQLMNQSINDPSGLQDSLINISKQFTYFDEKSKTYKINPQGILTLKEMEKQTGVSAKALRDAAISAADFDERLQAVGKATLFPEATEDDKKLLANMARMGEGGEYEISIGGEYQKISEIQADQLKQLVKEQKEGPKTVEEIQKSTLEIDKSILANAKEINQKLSKNLLFGEKSLQGSMEFTRAIRETGKTTAASAFPKEFSEELKKLQEERAKETDPAKRQALDTEIIQLVQGNMKTSLQSFSEGLKKSGDVIGGSVGKTIEDVLNPMLDVSFGKGGPGRAAGTGGATRVGGIPTPTVNAPSNQINPEWIYGTSQRVQQANAQNQANQQQVKIDASDIPSLPKRIDVYFNKPASVDFSTIEEALSSGVLKIEEATFNAVEKTAKRLGKQSRLP